jgi:hypothetical protein
MQTTANGLLYMRVRYNITNFLPFKLTTSSAANEGNDECVELLIQYGMLQSQNNAEKQKKSNLARRNKRKQTSKKQEPKK